jgi:hypothetical protein
MPVRANTSPGTPRRPCKPTTAASTHTDAAARRGIPQSFESRHATAAVQAHDCRFYTHRRSRSPWLSAIVESCHTTAAVQVHDRRFRTHSGSRSLWRSKTAAVQARYRTRLFSLTQTPAVDPSTPPWPAKSEVL